MLAYAAAAVRAGGTLLIVGRDLLNLTEGWGGPTQPDVLFTPDDVVMEIDDLRVEKAQRVRRIVEEPGASREAIDALVRARRLPLRTLARVLSSREMSPIGPLARGISYADYLVMERSSPERHEFLPRRGVRAGRWQP